jgi:IMP cyclohydrolase
MCRNSDCALAERNLIALQNNPYPGRGLIVGVDESGQYLVQLYWIMGGSENSQNRVFSVYGGRVFTEAADPSKVQDPSLIIYHAMLEYECNGNGHYVVSNGDQTDTFFREHQRTINLQDALKSRTYEPDAPNFTPRITSAFHLFHQSYIAEILMLRKSLWGDTCDTLYYRYAKIENGYGLCLTTYSGDGDPLPSFHGEPLLMPLPYDIGQILHIYWEALNQENRVSLAVKFISIETGKSQIRIVNKHTRV